ncbi:MAG: 50S ribosomal protein L25/general stress protein Ctc [Dechloromonas sp.]|jgi:large subunit ribosomal protein L25|uniref:50S ribosomal protein L25/general stress protein Ctc n=1 Tax=Azonexus sp. TaxID=1872668 RepID=UPI0035B3EF15|nr:50S ribosomal protein L25/general stress protein Ctc [Dechloromonas sp.]
MQFEVIAQARTLQGTGASRRLRRAGMVPGIIYGGEAAPIAIETHHNDLLLKMKKEAFHSSIINVVVDGKKEQVLLRDYQTHAYKQQILHIDFQRVDATHELHIKVPLHFVNEENGPGVKLNGGLVNHVLTEVDVHCLAKDLPEFIEVDLGSLNVGESIHASQLKLPAGVQLVQHGSDDPIVAGVVGKGGSAEAAEGEAAAE